MMFCSSAANLSWHIGSKYFKTWHSNLFVCLFQGWDGYWGLPWFPSLPDERVCICRKSPKLWGANDALRSVRPVKMMFCSSAANLSWHNGSKYLLKSHFKYNRKVVSSNTPCLEAHDGFFKLFMKGRDFHSYVGKYCDFLTKSWLLNGVLASG